MVSLFLILVVVINWTTGVAAKAVATAAVQGEEGIPTIITTTTCEVDSIQFTTTDALGPFYVEDSITNSVIAPRRLLIDPTDVFTVNGKIIGNDCKPLAGARIEAWYAGEDDITGKGEYLEDGYRGQVLSDGCGNFQFVQTFPAVYQQRPIPHIHYRVSSPAAPNEENNQVVLLVTQLYFEGVIVAGYNPDETKISKITNEPDGSRSAQFDIYVRIPGNVADITACNKVSSGEGGINNNNNSNNNATTTLLQNELLETILPSETMQDATTTMPPSSFVEGSSTMMNETGGVAEEAATVIEDTTTTTTTTAAAGDHHQCGSVVCEPGLECCNPSCGTCSKPGGLCIQDGCIGPFEQTTEEEEEEEEEDSAASLSKTFLDLDLFN